MKNVMAMCSRREISTAPPMALVKRNAMVMNSLPPKIDADSP